MIPPDTMRDHDRWRPVRHDLVRRDRADGHRQAKHVKEAFGDGVDPGLARSAVVGEKCRVLWLQAGRPNDGQRWVVEPHNFARGQKAGRHAAVGQGGPQSIEVACGRVRQRPEQRGVDGAEDGGRRAHTEGKCCNRGERKRWRPAQVPHGKPEILKQCIHAGI